MKGTSKEKKSSKDKKKGQAADGAEKRPVRAKVDELMVSVGSDKSCGYPQVHSNPIYTGFFKKRCTIRSWRTSTATSRTGFIRSTCTEERLEMTTNTRWMMTGLLADSRLGTCYVIIFMPQHTQAVFMLLNMFFPAI